MRMYVLILLLTLILLLLAYYLVKLHTLGKDKIYVLSIQKPKSSASTNGLCRMKEYSMMAKYLEVCYKRQQKTITSPISFQKYPLGIISILTTFV